MTAAEPGAWRAGARVATRSASREQVADLDQQIVDLIAVSGTYVTVAMLLNAAQEPAPGGVVIEPLR